MNTECDFNIVELIPKQPFLLKEDSLWLPTWLNKEFLSKKLQNYYKKNELCVTDFDVKRATANGDNYWSTIYRLKVYLSSNIAKQQAFNMIVKLVLPEGTAHDLVSSTGVFKKEIEFYGQIVPQMNFLLKNLNEGDRMFPIVYGVCDSNEVMLLEDLNLNGFQLISVKKGFNVLETKATLKRIAAFHAIGGILHQQEPDIFENFTCGLVAPSNKISFSFFTSQFKALLEQISSWPDFKYYADKLKCFQKYLMPQAFRATKASDNQFNTLIHSDLWANNILVKYGDKEKSMVDDVTFIDFQFVSYGSPAIDLYFFLFTSLQIKLLSIEIIDEFVEFYHGYLTKFLFRLNYQNYVPNLEEFRFQIRSKCIYAFIASCLNKPQMINEHTEIMDLETTAIGNERTEKVKRRMYQSENIKEHLRKMIPFCDKLGVFDL